MFIGTLERNEVTGLDLLASKGESPRAFLLAKEEAAILGNGPAWRSVYPRVAGALAGTGRSGVTAL
jgi:hypothetical protein